MRVQLWQDRALPPAPRRQRCGGRASGAGGRYQAAERRMVEPEKKTPVDLATTGVHLCRAVVAKAYQQEPNGETRRTTQSARQSYLPSRRCCKQKLYT